MDVDGEVADDSLEAERRLEKIRRSHAEKERQELEELKQRQVLEQQELEELNSRRGDRRRLREEEECRMEEEKQHKQMEEVVRPKMQFFHFSAYIMCNYKKMLSCNVLPLTICECTIFRNLFPCDGSLCCSTASCK